MRNWDYLVAHPDLTHASYIDDDDVRELLDRAQIDPAKVVKPDPKQQTSIFYNGHPTHWLIFTIYSGFENTADNGYAALVFARKYYTEFEAREKLRSFFIHSGAKLTETVDHKWPDPK